MDHPAHTLVTMLTMLSHTYNLKLEIQSYNDRLSLVLAYLGLQVYKALLQTTRYRVYLFSIQSLRVPLHKIPFCRKCIKHICHRETWYCRRILTVTDDTYLPDSLSLYVNAHACMWGGPVSEPSSYNKWADRKWRYLSDSIISLYNDYSVCILLQICYSNVFIASLFAATMGHKNNACMCGDG